MRKTILIPSGISNWGKMKHRNKTVKISLKKGCNIHLIGIGGTGMIGIAHCLLQREYNISGSDLQSNNLLKQLHAQGIKIYPGHNERHINPNCHLVVKSAAIKDDNPEIVKAKQLQIPVIKYSQMLGLLMRDKYGIAVAGCHGKTTTSALMAYTLKVAKQYPSFVIGGYVTDLGTSAELSKGKHFVAEACEYDRSFLNLSYKIAVINNIESDHLDYYKNLKNIIGAFRTFARQLPKNGIIIANTDNQNVIKAISKLPQKIISFGLNDRSKKDWTAIDIRIRNNQWQFIAVYHGKPYGRFILGIPGEHNINNALAVIALAHFLGLNKAIVKKALSKFKGVARRFQQIGLVNGARVIDDYGHHPTEIKAVIKTAREKYSDKKIWMVFQPHQASRTRLFLDDFARVFTKANITIVSDIYFARDSESEKRRVKSSDLVKRINQYGGNSLYVQTFPEIIKYLKKHLTKNDVVITMGAGDVWKISRQLATL